MQCDLIVPAYGYSIDLQLPPNIIPTNMYGVSDMGLGIEKNPGYKINHLSFIQLEISDLWCYVKECSVPEITISKIH